MSNQTVLDAGQPPGVTVTTDADGNPSVSVPEPGSAAMTAAVQHANALAAVVGTESAPTELGTYLRRLPTVQIGISVVGHVCTVGPGTVIAVQAQAGAVTGPKAIIVFGSPSSGQVRVDPQPDGTQQLTFRAADAVTTCAVYLQGVPEAMIAALDATPEE